MAEWFPKKERALATGIFNSGTNVGALVAPLVVPWITLHWGWQWAFIVTGAIGFIWLVLLAARSTARRRSTRGCRPAELAYIRSDPAEPITPIAVARADPPPPDLGLRHRQVHDRSRSGGSTSSGSRTS